MSLIFFELTDLRYEEESGPVDFATQSSAKVWYITWNIFGPQLIVWQNSGFHLI